MLLVGLKLWTGSDNDIRRCGRDSEGVPVNSSHGSRRQITLRDECRLLAGNSEIGRSSPPSFSNANPNHYTATKSTVNSSQRRETRRSTRHTILRYDELTVLRVNWLQPTEVHKLNGKSIGSAECRRVHWRHLANTIEIVHMGVTWRIQLNLCFLGLTRVHSTSWILQG